MSFSSHRRVLRPSQSFYTQEPESFVGNWTLFLGLVSLVYALVFFRRRSATLKNSDVHRLRCPPDAHWLWGHEKTALVDKSCPEAYNEWHDSLSVPDDNSKVGGIGAYRIKGALGYGDIIIPTDPLALSHILSSTSIYHKSPYFRPLIERLLGRSIVWAEGEDHKYMRRALGPCFSEAKVREWEGVVNGCAQRLAGRLLLHVLYEQETRRIKLRRPTSHEPASDADATDPTNSEPDSPSVSRGVHNPLRPSRNQDSQPEGVIVNMMNWPSRATLDIIGFVGFDHDFECGESVEAKEIFRLWREQSDMGITFAGFLAPILFRQFPFLNNLLPLPIKRAQEATKRAIHRLSGPILAREGVFRSLPADHHLNATSQSTGSMDDEGDGEEDEFKYVGDDHLGVVKELAEGGTGSVKAFAKRMSSWRSMDLKGVSGEGNLLTYMIRASAKDQETEGKGKAKESVNIAELLDHISTFVMVGHETSAGTISFTLDALARNPECQSRLRNEIRHYCQGATESEESKSAFAYDDLMDSTKLPYLDAVVKEGLRLFVPPAQTERVAQQEDVIPLRHPVRAADGTTLHSLRIQKGQNILLSWASIHSNNTIWGPTGDSFIPERWLPDTGLPTPPEVTMNGWSHLASFSEGPRICLGYRLALLEVKMILVHLVRDFIFEPVDEAPVLDGFRSNDVVDSSREFAPEMMDVRLRRTFAGLVQPSVVDGERVGMGGVWLPVRVRPTQETSAHPEVTSLRDDLADYAGARSKAQVRF